MFSPGTTESDELGERLSVLGGEIFGLVPCPLRRSRRHVSNPGFALAQPALVEGLSFVEGAGGKSEATKAVNMLQIFHNRRCEERDVWQCCPHHTKTAQANVGSWQNSGHLRSRACVTVSCLGSGTQTRR